MTSAAPPPAPTATPGGGPVSGSATVPSMPGAPGVVSGSAQASGSQPVAPPPSDDLDLAEREKRRLKQREESLKKEEEEERHTLFVTENAFHDLKTGRYDPFVEVDPYRELNPVVGMAINSQFYRVTGFAKQGDKIYGVVELGMNFTLVPPRAISAVAVTGDAFYKDYMVQENQLLWRGQPVQDGEILPTGEIVDEAEVYKNLVVVSQIDMDKGTITLKTVPRDKIPSQQVTLELGSRKRAAAASTKPGEEVDLDIDPNANNDEYIRYLYEKTNNPGGKKKRNFNDYLKNLKKKNQQEKGQGEPDGG